MYYNVDVWIVHYSADSDTVLARVFRHIGGEGIAYSRSLYLLKSRFKQSRFFHAGYDLARLHLDMYS